MAVYAAHRTRQQFVQLSGQAQNKYVAQHLGNSSGFLHGSPLLSLTLNNVTAAYFALGGVDTSNEKCKSNADGHVYLATLNNATTVYPAVGGRVKGFEVNDEYGAVGDAVLKFSDDVEFPVAELVLVGGYYFYDSISIEDAFKQDPKTYLAISDLKGSTLSTQMFEPNTARLEYSNFQAHFDRIKPYIQHLLPVTEQEL